MLIVFLVRKFLCRRRDTYFNAVHSFLNLCLFNVFWISIGQSPCPLYLAFGKDAFFHVRLALSCTLITLLLVSLDHVHIVHMFVISSYVCTDLSVTVFVRSFLLSLDFFHRGIRTGMQINAETKWMCVLSSHVIRNTFCHRGYPHVNCRIKTSSFYNRWYRRF